MTSQICFRQKNLGKYAGLPGPEKEADIFIPWAARQRPTELCVHNFWAPLYSPLSPPPLCFSGRVNSRWKKKKRGYLCSDKKERKKEKSPPEWEQKSLKWKCRFFPFVRSTSFKITVCMNYSHILRKRSGFVTKQQADCGKSNKLFQQNTWAKNFSRLEKKKPIQRLILFFPLSYLFLQTLAATLRAGLS